MHLHLVTLTPQRSPDCDMVLVHDVDLAWISGVCDSNVNKHYIILVSSFSHLQSLESLLPDVVENHLQGSNAEVHTDLYRKLCSYHDFFYSHRRHIKRFIAYQK